MRLSIDVGEMAIGRNADYGAIFCFSSDDSIYQYQDCPNGVTVWVKLAADFLRSVDSVEWIYVKNLELPEWWNWEQMERDIRGFVQEWLSGRVFVDGGHRISTGEYYIGGTASVKVFGNGSVYGFDDVDIEAGEEAKVTVCGQCKVSAHDKVKVCGHGDEGSWIFASDNVFVEVFGGTVVARNWAKVNAHGKAIVEAHNAVEVVASEFAEVTALDNVRVRASNCVKVLAKYWSQVEATDEVEVTAMDSVRVNAYGNIKVAYSGDKVILKRFDSGL